MEAAWGTGQGRGVPERRRSPESACVPRSSLCCGQNVHPAWPTGKERTFPSRQTNHILSSVDLGICKGPQSVLTSLTQTAGAVSSPCHSCGASWGHTGAGRMWLKEMSSHSSGNSRRLSEPTTLCHHRRCAPRAGDLATEERVGSGGLPSTRVAAPAEGPVRSAGLCGVSAALRPSLCGHSCSTCGPAVPSGLRSRRGRTELPRAGRLSASEACSCGPGRPPGGPIPASLSLWGGGRSGVSWAYRPITSLCLPPHITSPLPARTPAPPVASMAPSPGHLRRPRSQIRSRSGLLRVRTRFWRLVAWEHDIFGAKATENAQELTNVKVEVKTLA